MRRFAALASAVVLVTLPASGQRAWETPGESDARDARALARSGRCTEALAPFDRAIAHRQRDASLRRDRGYCHEQLGNPQPAIDDYRSYLSMDPNAPDAEPVRTRLADLKAAHPPPPEPPAPPPAETPAATAADVEPDPLLRDAEPPAKTQTPETGWLFGPLLGVRGWSADGFPGTTVTLGVETGYAYTHWGEVDIRAAILRTKESDARGFGLSAQQTWRFPIGGSRRGEILLPIGGGFERQRDDARRTQDYFFARAAPSLRWAVLPSVALQGGAEITVGRIPQPEETRALVETGSRTALSYGGYVSVLWWLGTQPSARRAAGAAAPRDRTENTASGGRRPAQRW